MNIYTQWRFSSFILKINKQLLKLNNKYAAIIGILFIFAYYPCYAATNTDLYGDDKYAGPFPIGFTFNYYGNNFNEFYVTSNGLIQFTNPTTSYTNTCLPKFQNTLYVFWDDLKPNIANQPSGTIHYETQGEAPNRQLIVQWTNQYFFGSNLPMGAFQAILYEGSNLIKYQYRYLTDDRSRGNSATIGIQDSSSNFVQIGCNTANAIKPEQAILFTPNENMSDYSTDKDASYHFIDISGLTSDTPIPNDRYTNKSPTWSWKKINSLNTYEIDIQDPSGNSIHKKIVGDVNQFTFVDGFQNGQSYRARIRGSINNGGTWEVWSSLSDLVTIDTVRPTVSLDQFDRINGNTAKITFTAQDNLSGIKSGHLQIANNPSFDNILIDQEITVYTNSYQIENLPDSNELYARLLVIDKAGNESGYTNPLAITIKPPVLINPVTNMVVKTSTLNVQGTTETSGTVQLYLNNVAIGKPITVNEKGYFAQDVQLNNEGDYQINAILSNNFGSSKQSNPISFKYKIPMPTVMITTPVNNQEIYAPLDIQINANDELGIEKIDIYLDNKLISTLTEQPYQTYWSLTAKNNGSHELIAKVTNTSGKIATNKCDVTVRIEPPAPPPTIYTGKVSSITPAISYGIQPIIIKGQAIYRTDNIAATNVPIKLVLKVNGFERKISVATDDQGNFSYTFVPQETDTGTYQVAVIHPDEKTMTPQASFTINRISFELQDRDLKAIRNIPLSVDVSATANTKAKNLRWILTADNQPNGNLPKGIKIISETIDIDIGETKEIPFDFIADDTAAQTGSFHLVAIADDSGDMVRGQLQINYQLGQARPFLYATPNHIQTGLQRGSMTNVVINLVNKGLVQAKNVQITLVDELNKPAPNWLFIATDKIINSIDVDEQVQTEIIVQPDKTIAEGIYLFNIKLTDNKDISTTIPVSISVTQNDLGTAQFDIADIYTATLDSNGQLIAGLKDATIKLQNEAVLTQEYTITSNTQGIALIENIPIGIYRYRVSADNHMDVTGRIVIRPNTTSHEHIFLEYQIINVEFDVTETSIKDIYDVNLNATFNTQVPAPIVLIEPMSINLAGLQLGEEKTGQLVVTNYGLIQAKNVRLNLPQTDMRFKYEFFGEMPDILMPKEKIIISYRVTALSPNPEKRIETKIINEPALFENSSPDNSCSSYSSSYSEEHESECANGDISKGNSNGFFYLNQGNCPLSNSFDLSNINNGSNSDNSSPSAMPITPGCSPNVECASGGASSGAD